MKQIVWAFISILQDGVRSSLSALYFMHAHLT